MTIRAGRRVGYAGMLALLLSSSVLMSGVVLAQSDIGSSPDQSGQATEAGEVSEKADAGASFGQGSVQTPLDQRRNAVTFGQMDADEDGVLSEEEARQAGQLELFERLESGEGEVTREMFREEVGSETLPEVAE